MVVSSGLAFNPTANWNTWATQTIDVTLNAGAARLASCAACSGGQKVGYLGNGAANYVTLTVNVPSSGSYLLTIYGTVNGTRSFSVSVNGGADQTVSFTGTSFDTPIPQVITVSLNAGSNTIRFHNDGAYAPDLDRIVIQ